MASGAGGRGGGGGGGGGKIRTRRCHQGPMKPYQQGRPQHQVREHRRRVGEGPFPGPRGGGGGGDWAGGDGVGRGGGPGAPRGASGRPWARRREPRPPGRRREVGLRPASPAAHTCGSAASLHPRPAPRPSLPRGFPRAGAQGGNTSPRPTVGPEFCPFFFFWRGLGAWRRGGNYSCPLREKGKSCGWEPPLPPRLQISSLPRFSACGEGGCPKGADPHPAGVPTWGLAGALLQGKWNNLFSIL